MRSFLIRMRTMQTAYRYVSTTYLTAWTRDEAEALASKLWPGAIILPPINRNPSK